MKQKTLFDEENRLELLSQLGDPLEILNRVIKWEKFRSVLNQGCRRRTQEREDARRMTW